MRENIPETVYPLEWSGFPGATDARQQAQADLRLVDDRFNAPVLPADALAVNAVLEAEQTAAFREADESGIYDYMIEMQRPVPPLEEPVIEEKEDWRQRTRRLMGKAGEALKEASVSAFAVAQAKAEEFYGDEERGDKRKKISGAVVGALALGATTYLSSKGLISSHSASLRTAERVIDAKAASVPHSFGFTALQHAASVIPHHHEHARQATEVTLRAGSDPWHVTEAQMHAHGIAHPSDTKVAMDDARLLELNHISPLQALKLHVGTKLQLLKKW